MEFRSGLRFAVAWGTPVLMSTPEAEMFTQYRPTPMRLTDATPLPRSNWPAGLTTAAARAYGATATGVAPAAADAVSGSETATAPAARTHAAPAVTATTRGFLKTLMGNLP